MKARLINIHTPDVESCNPADFVPNEKDVFSLFIQIIISFSEAEGEEWFNVVVCSPKWFATEFNQEDVILGHHYIIMFEYDYLRLEKRIRKYVGNLNGRDVNDLYTQLARIGITDHEDPIPLTAR